MPVDYDAPGVSHLKGSSFCEIVSYRLRVLLPVQEELKSEVTPTECLTTALKDLDVLLVSSFMLWIRNTAPISIADEVGVLVTAFMVAFLRDFGYAIPPPIERHVVSGLKREHLVLIVEPSAVAKCREANCFLRLLLFLSGRCFNTYLPWLHVDEFWLLLIGGVLERIVNLTTCNGFVLNYYLVGV